MKQINGVHVSVRDSYIFNKTNATLFLWTWPACIRFAGTRTSEYNSSPAEHTTIVHRCLPSRDKLLAPICRIEPLTHTGTRKTHGTFVSAFFQWILLLAGSCGRFPRTYELPLIALMSWKQRLAALTRFRDCLPKTTLDLIHWFLCHADRLKPCGACNWWKQTAGLHMAQLFILISLAILNRKYS